MVKEKTKEELMLKREKILAKNIVVMHQELQQIVILLEGAPQKLPRVGAVIGGRIELILQMMRDLSKDEDFRKRFKNYIEELNEEQKKQMQAHEKSIKTFNTPNYFG